MKLSDQDRIFIMKKDKASSISSMGVALHFSLQLANHKSQGSNFGAVWKANNGT